MKQKRIAMQYLGVFHDNYSEIILFWDPSVHQILLTPMEMNFRSKEYIAKLNFQASDLDQTEKIWNHYQFLLKAGFLFNYLGKFPEGEEKQLLP